MLLDRLADFGDRELRAIISDFALGLACNRCDGTSMAAEATVLLAAALFEVG